MNRRMVLAATAALGLCTALAVGRAVAHPPDGDAPPPPGMHMGGPGPWGPGKVEERLAKLHEALKLSPDQAAAWETFATQAKERAAQARADRPDPQTWAKLSAPDRLDQIAARMKVHQAIWRRWRSRCGRSTACSPPSSRRSSTNSSASPVLARTAPAAVAGNATEQSVGGLGTPSPGGRGWGEGEEMIPLTLALSHPGEAGRSPAFSLRHRVATLPTP